MKLVETIKIYYLLYTIYSLYVLFISDYDITVLLLGLLSLWSIYFVFLLGYRRVNQTEIEDVPIINENYVPFKKIKECSPWKYVIYAILCWVSSIVAVKFYTGKNFADVFSSILNGSSMYTEYQTYFREQGIATFSLNKIIYILMLTYVTIMLFVGFIGILIPGKKKRPSEIIFLIAIVCAYLYVGIARGTNFEMFIVFVLLVYILLNKRGNNKTRKKLSKKNIFIITILGILMIFVFRLVLEARGIVFKNEISNEIKFNKDSLLATLFPTITSCVTAVFAYLGYGISAIGFFFKDITFSSLPCFLAIFCPYGYNLLFDMSMREVVNLAVDIGVNWVPDYIGFIGYLGLPLFYIFVFSMGFLSAKARYNKKVPDIVMDLISFVVFLQMISFPIGKFIINSTANELTVLFIIFCYICCFVRIRIKSK